MARIAAEDRADSTDNFSLLTGDFNSLAEGEHRFKVGRPIATANLSRPIPATAQPSPWKAILDSLSLSRHI